MTNKYAKDEDLGHSIGEWVRIANSRYERWSKKFKIESLYKYYEGFQWKNQDDEYVFNLFYSTLEIKLPAMAFMNPRFFVTPKPVELATDSEEAFKTASNLEDALFDWTSDDEHHFNDEMEACLFDSCFGFGVVEVGYSAKFRSNPNAQKPTIPGDYSPNDQGKKPFFTVSPFLAEDEQIYCKQIPFHTFRVSGVNSRYLDRADWCGYYEYYRVEDLKADKKLRNTDDLPDSGRMNVQGLGLSSNSETPNEEMDSFKLGGRAYNFVKVWKIYDNRKMRWYLWCEDNEKVLFDTHYKYLPFETLLLRKPKEGFYPVPMTFNWLPMQNELNEVRETHRTHRRKFKRIYEMKKNVAKTEEVLRALNGPDGQIIEVERMGEILPIPTAELGASANISMQVAKDDFNTVSGTTSEMRGENDRTTATQANISNNRAVVRESRERQLAGKFYVRVAKLILKTMKDNMINRMNVSQQNVEEGLFSDISNKRSSRTIDPINDFGHDKFDFALTISVESMSPVQNQEEYNKFLNFLSLLKNFPEFAASPKIIREMAFRTGYKNERVISDFQQMAQLAMVAKVQQAQQSAQAQGMDTNFAQKRVASQTPPNNEEIRNQIQEQGIPIQ